MRLRRLTSIVLLFTAVVLLAVAAFEAADLWLRRSRALRVAEQRAGNMALAIAEYVRGTFAAFDSSLRQLAVHGERIGGSGAPSSEWLPILQSAQAALDERGSISVTDAAGVIRHSTLPAIVGQSRADNYLFKYLSANDPRAMIVDVPFRSPVRPDLVVLPVGRRLETRDGAFDGIIVAVITPETFAPFFRTVPKGRNGSISIFHPDGVVLFREPSKTNPLGEDATSSPLLTAARQNGSGAFTGPIEPDGETFINAYRTLGSPPLILAVSLSTDEVLADWREQLRNEAVEMVLLAGVLGLLVAVLSRQVAARSRVELELADVQRDEAQRLHEANERLHDALERERRAREDTEAAGRLKDEFLMTLSHELRTPLNAILGWVRMLATDAVPPDQRARALATIERNAHAQTRLVEDLLDVSRAISGKLRLRTRPVNVADPVVAAIETLEPAMDAKRIVLETDIDRTIPPIPADADRLQQVVWNLLSNAIKFTPADGRVRLRVAPADGGVEIVVEDTGAGIGAAFLPYVFDRFRQAEAGLRREHGGLGLGLAIVRHLVELHGGTITAESDGEGKGARFRIVLPSGGAR